MKWSTLLVVGLMACGAAEVTAEVTPEPAAEEAPEPAPSKVDGALVIAKAIKANPGKTDAILKKHGTDAAAFEALLFEIASDPAMSAEYAAGL